ncbi:MAG: hypothetical protein VXW65_09395 [Pseudomonadota bacterium]|nr:hypothetical protein [Pseudomonadota bacterium]
MNMFRRATTAAMLITLIGASIPAHAAIEIMEDELNERPTASATLTDSALARPLMAAATVGGAAVFVATLPFSILGGNVKETAKTLVLDPADATFRRCLGCTTVQDERKNIYQLEEGEAMSQ